MIRRLLLALVAVTATATAANAGTVSIQADGIYGDAQADGVCLDAADGARWNGQWTTTEWGRMSVCGCTVESGSARTTFDVEAGPIWDNGHAQQVCPQVCNTPQWTGAYSPDTAYAASTCELSYPGAIRGGVSVDAYAPATRIVVRPIVVRPRVNHTRIFRPHVARPHVVVSSRPSRPSARFAYNPRGPRPPSGHRNAPRHGRR